MCLNLELRQYHFNGTFRYIRPWETERLQVSALSAQVTSSNAPTYHRGTSALLGRSRRRVNPLVPGPPPRLDKTILVSEFNYKRA